MSRNAGKTVRSGKIRLERVVSGEKLVISEQGRRGEIGLIEYRIRSLKSVKRTGLFTIL